MFISVAGLAKRGDKYFVALRRPGTSIGESWEFPGGKVEPGEDNAAALKREFFEEFGVEVRVGELLCKSAFRNDEKEYELFAYDIELMGVPQPKEHQRLEWKPLSELACMRIADSDLSIIRALLND